MYSILSLKPLPQSRLVGYFNKNAFKLDTKDASVFHFRASLVFCKMQAQRTQWIIKMIKTKTRSIALFTFFSALLPPMHLHAQVSGKGELGFSDNNGNTDNSALQATLDLTYDQANYQFKSLLQGSYKAENDKQTEERYLLDLQGNYFFNPSKDFFSYAGLKLENNRFADIQLVTTVSAGIGKALLSSNTNKLTAEVGIGRQNTDYVTEDLKTKSQSVTIGKLDYKHQLSEQTSFGQNATYTRGNNHSSTEANTSISIKIAEKANLKLSYKYRHNNNPPDGTKTTDTETLMSLTYDF